MYLREGISHSATTASRVTDELLSDGRVSVMLLEASCHRACGGISCPPAMSCHAYGKSVDLWTTHICVESCRYKVLNRGEAYDGCAPEKERAVSLLAQLWSWHSQKCPSTISYHSHNFYTSQSHLERQKKGYWTLWELNPRPFTSSQPHTDCAKRKSYP